MRAFARWAIIVVAALVVVGLLAYARGPEHHRGDEVGALVIGAGTSTTG
jgi:hypothetical protein